MPKVHLLEDELINKIAAGEVVERPASVVKELVENAIDAGATQIDIDIEEGGRKLIRITDNGSGMPREDAALALKRHCTSKIRSMDDLFQVATMGFRGEALASISAISQFTLSTQTKDQSEGTRISFSDGKQQIDPWSGAVGTQISVADIFYNVPARKAFLKTAAAEFAQCHEFVHALALSRPDLGLRLKHNGKVHLDVEPVAIKTLKVWGEEAIRTRAASIFPDAKKSMVYVLKKDNLGTVEALLSPPGLEKGSGKFIFTFVNQRWVKDKTIRYSVLRGYHSHLLKGKFPLCALNITIDPTLVDVNVHPAKAEVRFQYNQEVQSMIAQAIKERLREGDWAVRQGASFAPSVPSPSVPPMVSRPDPISPKVGTHPGSIAAREVSRPAPVARNHPPRGGEVETKTTKQPSPIENDFDVFFKPERKPKEAASHYYKPANLTTKVSSFDNDDDVELDTTFASSPKGESQGSEESSLKGPPTEIFESSHPDPAVNHSAKNGIVWEELTFLGAFAKCYLLFEGGGELIALDQHAFHERVLYERLLKNSDILHETQPLLVPEVLQLGTVSIQNLQEKKAVLTNYGFKIEIVSETEVEVQSVPTLLKNADLELLIENLARSELDSDPRSELGHQVLSTIACHSAVRAGEELPEAELDFLLREARTVDFYQNCPHGRRVFKIWQKRDVEKWFDR